MNQLVREALFAGMKEGITLFLCVYLLLAFFKGNRLDHLKVPLFAGLFTVFSASFVAMSTEVTIAVRDGIVKMIGYVFGLLYLFSLGALFHTTGTDMLGPFRRVAGSTWFLVPSVFLLTVAYFVPDMAGSSLYVADLFSMSGRRLLIFTAAGASFALSLAASYLGARRIKVDISKLLALPQLLLFLALVKLVAGGVRGFAELSLIPVVKAGLMKLVHDAVHQTFVFLMVPDHPILTTTAWNFIGILFGDTVGTWLSLIVLVLPLVCFVKKHFDEDINVPSEIQVSAFKRLFVKSVRDQRVLKSIPVFAFMLFIAGTWFVRWGESVNPLYNPEPKLISADGNKVRIPIQPTGEDLRDGTIHKFLLSAKGQDMRLLIMKKPDGSLAVCLDACEICQPDGYAQGKEHVVCLYCRTPIPFDTVGKPGGCNPIPLTALVTEKDVQIDIGEIVEKWALAKTGERKENAGR